MTAGIRRGLDYAVVFVAYVATARMGLSFDALSGIATTVWPPTGIALAALILRGTRCGPRVSLAAFVVNLATGIPIWGAAIIATGNTLEAVVGAALLRRFSFDPRLGRLRDVLLLVGWAALASTLISATFGVAAAALANLQRAESYPVFWAVWWVGDAMANVLIAPLICVWASPLRWSRRPLRWLECGLLIAALALVSMIVFRASDGRARDRVGPRHVCARAGADLGGAALRAARDDGGAAAGLGDRGVVDGVSGQLLRRAHAA
jgi:integral membrane sensor domain MASE1